MISSDILIGLAQFFVYLLYFATFFCVGELLYSASRPSGYENYFEWMVGRKKEAKTGSNARRIYSRLVLLFGGLFLLMAAMEPVSDIFKSKQGSGLAAVAMGMLFFILSVASMPFLQKSPPELTAQEKEEFEVSLNRLLYDTVLSSAFLIVAFSLVYIETGICFGNVTYSDRLNSLYFSAVTFSTLGFGDFTPSPQARPYAAFQALIGNVHLGIIAGSTFAILNRSKK